MPKDFRKDVGRISQKDLVEKYSCQGTGASTGLNRSLRRQFFNIQPINTGQLAGGFEILSGVKLFELVHLFGDEAAIK